MNDNCSLSWVPPWSPPPCICCLFHFCSWLARVFLRVLQIAEIAVLIITAPWRSARLPRKHMSAVTSRCDVTGCLSSGNEFVISAGHLLHSGTQRQVMGGGILGISFLLYFCTVCFSRGRLINMLCRRRGIMTSKNEIFFHNSHPKNSLVFSSWHYSNSEFILTSVHLRGPT